MLTLKLLLREANTYRKTIWIVIAPIILSPLCFYGDPGKCAYCILLMSCYWVAEVLPLAVTSFLPLFVLPFLGILPIKSIASQYLSDTNMVFLTSLMLSVAVEECNLHKRVALKMLTFVGSKPQWLMAGFMIITSFISLWISDTACAALMSPIAYALLEAIMIPKMENEKNEDDFSIATEIQKEELDVTRLSKRNQGICKCMMLIVAHASLIGGTGTINSTGPNLIFRDTIEKFYPEENYGISYLSWMLFAVPPMAAYMLASWIVVQVQFLGFRYVSRIFSASSVEEKADEKIASEVVVEAYEKLGPMTWAEKSTLIIFVTTVFTWVTSDPKFVPGWASLFKKGFVTDSCTGMIAVVFLFIWPKDQPDFVFLRKDKLRATMNRQPLLTWDVVRRKFPWSIIILLGAGFSISASVKASGLSNIIACNMESWLTGYSYIIMQLLVSIIVVAMTEFSTNSATASIFIPISFNIAESVKAHPLYFSIPSALGPSFAFMFPMATPANAIVYETNTMTMWDMASCGFFLNILCIGITILNMNTYTFWLFNMGDYPTYVFAHNNTSGC